MPSQKVAKQRGFANILVTLLILIGIVLGVYLVRNQQTFRSHADNDQTRITINGESASTSSSEVKIAVIYQTPQATPEPTALFPSSGLISYWKMDDLSGNTLSDSLGINNALIHGTTISPGKIGYGRNFYGKNDYLSSSNTNFSSGSGAFSVSAWFNTRYTGTQDRYMIFWGKQQAGTCFGVGIQNKKVLVTQCSAGLYSNTNISDGNWYNVVVTQDGSGDYSLYIDGNLSAGGQEKMATSINLTGTNYIGRTSYNNQYFIGSLDEVGIWNRALTGNEVSNLFNNGRGLTFVRNSSSFPSSFRLANDDPKNLYQSFEQTFVQNNQIVDWNLSPGNGPKTVYAQFKVNGVWTTPISASINLTSQTTAPLTRVKIMPLGDSITRGVEGGIDANSPILGGYRGPLWTELSQKGYSVDFVGSQSSGPDYLPSKNHEGHNGYTSSQILQNIDSWLEPTRPDVVLMLVGTNDLATNLDITNAPNRLGTLIDEIAAKLPNAKILVGTIPPTSIYNNQLWINYNSSLPALINAKKSQGIQVNLVDINSSLTLSDLSDGVHPNDTGYQKIADDWYRALVGLGIMSAHQTNLQVTPNSLQAGQSVTVTWNNVANPTSNDFIGLYKPGIADANNYLDFEYTSTCSKSPGIAKSSGSCSFLINNPGTYEFRLFANSSYIKLASSNLINVSSNNPTLTLDKTNTSAGTTVTLNWSNLNNPTVGDFVSLYQTGQPNNPYTKGYEYTSSCGTSLGPTPKSQGSCTWTISSDTPPGTYEFRLFSNQSYNLLVKSAPLIIHQ